MIPYSIACKPNGAPFAARGEMDPDKWIAVVSWLDVEPDRGIVFLVQGGIPGRPGRCTARGWVHWIEENHADLVDSAHLTERWRALPAALAEHMARRVR